MRGSETFLEKVSEKKYILNGIATCYGYNWIFLNVFIIFIVNRSISNYYKFDNFRT